MNEFMGVVDSAIAALPFLRYIRQNVTTTKARGSNVSGFHKASSRVGDPRLRHGGDLRRLDVRQPSDPAPSLAAIPSWSCEFLGCCFLGWPVSAGALFGADNSPVYGVNICDCTFSGLSAGIVQGTQLVEGHRSLFERFPSCAVPSR
jgi:hypothetical protein